MSVKVKRGLGLLAIALLAWGVQWVVGYDGAATGAASDVISLARVVLLVCGASGLVLLAWGLLRD
jgi:hypothetical protein